MRREYPITSNPFVTVLDWYKFNFFNVSVQGNATFDVINPRPNSDFIILLTKDSTPSIYTITWPAGFVWVNSAPVSALSTPNETQLLQVTYFGGVYRISRLQTGSYLALPPTWSSAVSYLTGDVVWRSGMYWRALLANSNKDPLTSSEWEVYLGIAGGTLKSKLVLASSTAASAGLNIGGTGTVPLTPVNGDIYTDGTNIYAYIAGSQKQIQLGNGSMPVGSLRDSATATDTAARTFTGASSVIPQDTTVPLITEGNQLLTLNFTPKASTNKLKVRFTLQVSKTVLGTTPYVSATVFDGATFIGGNVVRINNAFDPMPLPFETELYTAGGTTLRTFQVRIGQGNADGTISTGGTAGGWTFGGSGIKSTLVVEEYVG